MNRNESFDASGINAMTVKLGHANVEVSAEEIASSIQVLVSGDQQDVNGLKLQSAEGTLILDQTFTDLAPHLGGSKWMQIFVRVPAGWKGQVYIQTVSGMINVNGLHGSDIVCDSISGNMKLVGLEAITLRCKSVSGLIRSEGCMTETMRCGGVSGDIRMNELQALTADVQSVSGDVAMDMASACDRVRISTVSGDITLSLKTDKADAAIRTVNGRLRTGGISLVEDADKVSLTTVTGNMTLYGTNKE